MTTPNQSPEPVALATPIEIETVIDWCLTSYMPLPSDEHAALLVDRLRYVQAAQPAQCVPEGVQREIAAALALFPIDISSQTFRVSGYEKALEADDDTQFYSKKKVVALLEKLYGHLTAAATPAPAPSGFAKALEIRAAQGWNLTGNAIPVLYTDTINGDQVMRDDVWLCTTAALKTEVPAPAVPQQLIDALARHNKVSDPAALKQKEWSQYQSDAHTIQSFCNADGLRTLIAATPAPAPAQEPAPVTTLPKGFSVTRYEDGVLYVSHERFGFTALTDEEKSLEGRLLYTLAGALLAALRAKEAGK